MKGKDLHHFTTFSGCKICVNNSNGKYYYVNARIADVKRI